MTARPPFRADHVGSLLRPRDIQEARVGVAAGTIDPSELASIEDRAVGSAIAKQEAAGLHSITDGEFRRATWLGDFLYALEGVTIVTSVIRPAGAPEDSPGKQIKIPKVIGKLGFSHHPMLEHFKFLRRHTRETPKMTIPAPAMLVSALRNWRDVVSPDAYPDVDEFYADLAATYRDAVRAFYDAGCRYLQFDDVNLAYLCHAGTREKLRARGDDPDAMLKTWVRVVNEAIVNRPDDMVITTHVCRGNFMSTWLVDGDYEPVADLLFNQFDYDGYFLEYDTDRAGGFEPLRLFPKTGKKLVLGLITTKSGALEEERTIKSRIDAAAKFVDLDNLCLSPQCGFASTEEGNLLTEDEQWAKLEWVVGLARGVWADA